MEIEIVYEDNDLIVLNKPSGLLTHPVNRQDTSESVVSWLMGRYPEIAAVNDTYGQSVGQWVDLRPGIVHRLDKETSGLIVAAKNQVAFDYLKNLFKDRQVKKTYLALAWGHFKEKRGVIESPLGKLQGKQTTKIHGKHDLQEKTAITEFKVIKEYDEYSLVEIFPKTGRMHQIRIHLQSIGHPLVCDPLYGSKNICPPGLGRLFLHAQKLQFVSPSGQALTLEAGLPVKLQDFLDNIAKK